MALVKCQECGHQVSRDAKACPACGTRKFDTSGNWVMWVIGGVATVMVLVGVSKNDAETRQQENLAAIVQASKTPEQRAAEFAAKQKAEAEFQFAVSAAKAVRASMKNPKSFELVSAGLVDGGALCLIYRGTNGFNAVVTQEAAVKRNGKLGAWNKDCAGKPVKDVASIRYAM